MDGLNNTPLQELCDVETAESLIGFPPSWISECSGYRTSFLHRASWRAIVNVAVSPALPYLHDQPLACRKFENGMRS